MVDRPHLVLFVSPVSPLPTRPRGPLGPSHHRCPLPFGTGPARRRAAPHHTPRAAPHDAPHSASLPWPHDRALSGVTAEPRAGTIVILSHERSVRALRLFLIPIVTQNLPFLTRDWPL